MAKTKTKFKGVLKGAALGFALIMTSAFFPAHAVANAIDYPNASDAKINTSRIQVDGENKSFAVKRGESVSIPEAEYLYKKADASQGSHTIGGAIADTITKSEVNVYYKATGDKVKVTDGVFTADKVGTYVIEYKVVDNKVSYTYEQLVAVEASEASFEFEQNDKNVVPKVYDVASANKKDIVLPLPTVNDEDGKAILTSEDKMYYVLNKDTSGILGDTKNVYVNISLANEVKLSDTTKLEIKSRTIGEGEDAITEFYLSGEDLSIKDGDNAILDRQDIKIYYSFYQKTANGYVFVSSTSKTFTVREDYYFTNDKEDTTGHDIVASFSGSKPDSAVVGVAVELPKVKATTTSTNSPASEDVEAYYELTIYKADSNGKYTEDGKVDLDKVITEDGKFKATEEGSYKFVYSVYDFYGKKAPESNTTFTIKNVKDSVGATAYIYDASNKNAYNKEENKYESAENLLKTQSVNRNIIMYAVGGTDNMVKRYEDLTQEEKEEGANYISLKRVITDNSGIERFVIDNEAYNAYNLIFAPGVESGSTTSVWKAIVNDNYKLFVDMTKAGVDLDSDAKIQEYLKANGYLIVTSENKDLAGEAIVTGEYTKDDAEWHEAMVQAGYAYVEPKTANYSFKEQTYTFYYYANDNMNNNAESKIYQTVKLSAGFTDESVPTLTFSSNLQSAYLPTEKFEFNAATAVDSVDARLETVTAYRYLNDKTPIITDDSEVLNYYVKNANSSLSSKWYATEGAHSIEGWYVADEKTCEVDLTKKPQGANAIEILAYAIDDYGNAGFFYKRIEIAAVTDADMPDLYKVVNAPEATNYSAPSEIVLPTLWFADAKSDYMHAQVAVYKLNKDGEGNVVSKTLVQNSGMKTSYDTQREYFKVDAGVFKASTEGDYQVAVSVVDSGNHSVTSYFSYKVVEGESTNTPKIDNISSDPIELEPGEAHYLVSPTFTMIDNEKYGYIGLDAEDDAYTSTYYNVSVVSSTSSDYELEKFYFTGNSEGTYQLQYTAFLIQYDKSAVVEEASKSANKLYFKDGKLKFFDGANDYFVYIDQENGNALAVNTSLQGNGTELADRTVFNTLVKEYVDQSEVQVIKVSEVFIKVSIDDDAYAQDKFENLDGEVKIIKPAVEFKGNNASMNKKESTVTISRTSSGITYNVATINFEDWQKTLADNDNFRIDGEDIYLVMKDHGEYKISYSIQAQTADGQNIGDANTDYKYTIASGDTKKPEIKVDNKAVIKEKYNIGDKLVIDMAGLTVSDGVTTDRDTLLKTLTVTVKNTTLNETTTLENKATEDGKYIYEIEELKNAGDYVITFTVKDEVGNISEEATVKFEVSTEESKPADVKEVMGGILIAVSVALLVGVVGYFVVSKVKLDKKEKSYKNAGKDKK